MTSLMHINIDRKWNVFKKFDLSVAFCLEENDQLISKA